jgi:hypothetical protein
MGPQPARPPWPWPTSVAPRRPRELIDHTAYFGDPALSEGRPLIHYRPDLNEAPHLRPRRRRQLRRPRSRRQLL